MTKTTTSPWRKLSIAIYGAPTEGKVYGTYDVDVTDMLAYIKKKKEEGKRITVTHFMVAALGKALFEDAPEVNCYVRRGDIVYRDSADVMISVLKKTGKGQTGMIVKDVQNKTVSEIAEFVEQRLESKREGKQDGMAAATKFLAKVPWPFRKMLLNFVKWWVFDMEFSLPGMKAPKSPFGSILLTNIGSFGLKTGMVALFPIGKLPGVITMGKIEERPVVIDGEIVIRSMMPLTGTFDHRIVDGAQIGKLAKGMQTKLADPALLDK